jgi:hypothetical protein
MKEKSRLIIAGIILTALVLSLTSSYAADKKFEKNFSVSPGGTLNLTTDVGMVVIIGTPSGEVRVLAEIKGKDRDVKKFEVSADQAGKDVNVTGRGPGAKWWFWGSSDLDVRFSIQVPREYNLNVRTSGGDIDVRNIKGGVLGKTSGGNLVVRDVEGTVKMETSGGNILSERVNGTVSFETSGGNVEIASTAGSVDATTSGGDIRVSDVVGEVRVETSGGNVSVKVSGGNKGIHASTSGGNIDISIPKDVGANIDASTSGGEVVCDLPVTMIGKIDESRLRGTLNGGGSTIYAHTSGGDVRIRKTE